MNSWVVVGNLNSLFSINGKLMLHLGQEGYIISMFVWLHRKGRLVTKNEVINYVCINVQKVYLIKHFVALNCIESCKHFKKKILSVVFSLKFVSWKIGPALKEVCQIDFVSMSTKDFFWQSSHKNPSNFVKFGPNANAS